MAVCIYKRFLELLLCRLFPLFCRCSIEYYIFLKTISQVSCIRISYSRYMDKTFFIFISFGIGVNVFEIYITQNFYTMRATGCKMVLLNNINRKQWLMNSHKFTYRHNVLLLLMFIIGVIE